MVYQLEVKITWELYDSTMRSEINSSTYIVVAQRLELIEDLEAWTLKCSHTFTM
jgi:hypothetical protein